MSKNLRPLLSAGFSLTELLLAIGIASILAVIAFATMRGISERRDTQICNSNLRQLYLLLQAYSADQGGRLPPPHSNVSGDITLHWRRALLPYMGKKATGSGTASDLFNTNLVCPTMNRSDLAVPAFRGLCNFGVNERTANPNAPQQRGIHVASIRNPSRFFLATESIIISEGLPKESIKPKDFDTYASRWNYHRNGRYQNVLFADGHIEFFENALRLVSTPYAEGDIEDVWTP